MTLHMKMSTSKNISICKIYPYCPDCGATFGQYHNQNCDLKECPVCYRPLQMCNCIAARFCDLEDNAIR